MRYRHVSEVARVVPYPTLPVLSFGFQGRMSWRE